MYLWCRLHMQAAPGSVDCGLSRTLGMVLPSCHHRRIDLAHRMCTLWNQLVRTSLMCSFGREKPDRGHHRAGRPGRVGPKALRARGPLWRGGGTSSSMITQLGHTLLRKTPAVEPSSVAGSSTNTTSYATCRGGSGAAEARGARRGGRRARAAAAGAVRGVPEGLRPPGGGGSRPGASAR